LRGVGIRLVSARHPTLAAEIELDRIPEPLSEVERLVAAR